MKTRHDHMLVTDFVELTPTVADEMMCEDVMLDVMMKKDPR